MVLFSRLCPTRYGARFEVGKRPRDRNRDIGGSGGGEHHIKPVSLAHLRGRQSARSSIHGVTYLADEQRERPGGLFRLEHPAIGRSFVTVEVHIGNVERSAIKFAPELDELAR